jgi:hypothetical protein
MLDKTRWFFDAKPMELTWHTPDPETWNRFSRAVEQALAERERSDPLEWVLKTFDISPGELETIMGVARQAIEKWRLSGPPAERSERIVTFAEIAMILHRRLRSGYVPAVVRRSAPAFGDKSILEALAEGEETDVLTAVKASFVYSSVA